MRAFVVFLAAAIAAQTPQPAATTAPDSRPPCVPTEPMPVLGLGRRPAEPMPVLRPDTARGEAMPVARRAPCYLVRSDTVRRRAR